MTPIHSTRPNTIEEWVDALRDRSHSQGEHLTSMRGMLTALTESELKRDRVLEDMGARITAVERFRWIATGVVLVLTFLFPTTIAVILGVIQ